MRGVNVHARQRVHGHDGAGVERLARYVPRPPVAQDRPTLLPDGRVHLSASTPWTGAEARGRPRTKRRWYAALGSMFAALRTRSARQASAAPLALALAACGSSGGSSGAVGECHFEDAASGLCWQDPPAQHPMTWQDAQAHCSTLGLRLPKIHELSTLVRGCPSLACSVRDPGCTASACSSDTSCAACAEGEGPGEGGCFWDPSLAGTCDWYWSISRVDEGPYDAWFLYFQSASVQNGAQGIEKYVRCVRGP